VLYDYQAFDMQRLGGVSRCFVENFKHLPADINAEFSVLESDNVYLQELGFCPVGLHRRHFLIEKEFKGKGRLFSIYNKIKGTCYGTNENLNYSIGKLKEGNFDVFHPTYFGTYFLEYIGKKPFVFTIHDMITDIFPQYFDIDDYQSIGKKIIAPKASKIVVVSEHTKNDVMRILRIPENKIEVIYHGCITKRVNAYKNKYDFPYLLYVGDRGNYKDFWMMIPYLIPVFEHYPSLRIVCTGHPFDSEEYALMNKYNIRDKLLCNICSDEELMNLYHFAKAFIYSSEYEGFGIPILEAYQAECPVLLNNASCFPEIAKDAAVYFEMNSEISNLEQKVEYVLQMANDEKENLISKQNERLKFFNWEKSAEQLANVYRSLV